MQELKDWDWDTAAPFLLVSVLSQDLQRYMCPRDGDVEQLREKAAFIIPASASVHHLALSTRCKQVIKDKVGETESTKKEKEWQKWGCGENEQEEKNNTLIRKENNEERRREEVKIKEENGKIEGKWRWKEKYISEKENQKKNI